MKNISVYTNAKEDLLGFEQHIQSYFLGALDAAWPIIFLRGATRSDPAVIEQLAKLLAKFGVKTRLATATKRTDFLGVDRYLHSLTYSSLESTYLPLRRVLEKLGPLAIAYRSETFRVFNNR